MAELDRSGSVERLELGPFGRAEVAAMLETIEGRPPDPDGVAAVVARSGGNPLLVEELARAGLDASTAAEPLRAGLRDLLLARVSELGPRGTGDRPGRLGGRPSRGRRAASPRWPGYPSLILFVAFERPSTEGS